MKAYGVTPSQPHFEPVGDKAVLNFEFTFETETETLNFESWKSVATFDVGETTETHGTATEFWKNIVAKGATPPNADTTTAVVNNQQIPKHTKILFFFAHTDYPKSRFPTKIAVTLAFREVASNAPISLAFTGTPKMHKNTADYIFPVGWSVGDMLPAGQTWGVGGGHELQTDHRRAMEWTPGVAWPPFNSQKYAYDLTLWDSQGRRGPKAELKVPEDYYCWGKNVYAAVTGIVTYVERDVPNLPVGGSPDPKDPAGGNGLIIEAGGGEYFVYAHLKQGSIPANILKGSKVYKGQRIGHLGNSGNTGGGPHLHFQVQDGGAYSKGTGQPSIFGNIEIKPSGANAFLKGPTAVPSNCAVHILHSSVAFVGVFREGTGGQSFTVGEDFKTFGQTIDKAFAHGLRLTSVQRFVDGGSAKFLGVFRSGTGGQSFTVGEDFATFGAAIDMMAAQGYRLSAVERF